MRTRRGYNDCNDSLAGADLARAQAAAGGAQLSENGRRQLRQPRLAELVARTLRDRITGGTLRDGDMLPRQEDLLDEFRVSKPSLREALRILETEGLVTVRRGNVGGAVVHAPSHHDAGYIISLVLESRGVTVRDVAVALRQLEPICAAMCAERGDRQQTVIPKLREMQARVREAVDDQIAFTAASRAFHEVLVAGCGNATMQLVVGALESVWTASERDWARRALDSGAFPASETRMAGVKAHERIIELIEKGDSAGAARASRKHLNEAQIQTGGGANQKIQAAGVRGI
jgi:GntR family transcriptional repressor for pyruvate dehydrogenase complex